MFPELERLRLLDDEGLWRVALQQLSLEQNERMQGLLEEKDAEDWSEEELREVQELQRAAQRVILLKAEAAVLLKERGHDISKMREQH